MKREREREKKRNFQWLQMAVAACDDIGSVSPGPGCKTRARIGWKGLAVRAIA